MYLVVTDNDLGCYSINTIFPITYDIYFIFL